MFPSRFLAVLLTTRRSIHTHVTVYGGGLAGLATTFHLLQEGVSVDIVDPCAVGTGGASAVAGGLVHPFSPRGKLVHRGLEGLEATNELIAAACQQSSEVVLRDEIFRVALTQENLEQLQKSAQELPDLCEWMESNDHGLGKLRLSKGCCVLNVPRYLQALWEACQAVAGDKNLEISWKDSDENVLDDTIKVYAAGSGLFAGNLRDKIPKLPIQLVHGQSLELSSPHFPEHPDALLFGKYIIPRANKHSVLIGATQEFKDEKLSTQQVQDLLMQKTRDVAGYVWKEDFHVDRVTYGTRTQANRGKHGRLPIVGQLSESDEWIFTGLSSRGLLYHGLVGKYLARAIVSGSDMTLYEHWPELDWWKE